MLKEEHFFLLGKISDAELAKEVGVSRERIRQIRTKHNIPKFNLNLEKEIILINYLKNNVNLIDISDVRKNTGITEFNGKYLSLLDLKLLAEKFNINCIFKCTPKCEHGLTPYQYGCRCDICRLSNCLKTYLIRHFSKSSLKFINFISNEYITFYNDDKSRHKKLFFDFVKKEYEKYLENDLCQFADISQRW